MSDDGVSYIGFEMGRFYAHIVIDDFYYDEKNERLYRDERGRVKRALDTAQWAEQEFADIFAKTPAPSPSTGKQANGRSGGSQGRSGQFRGRGETRADKFPRLEGWECDQCQGPVGRRAATGNMKSDAAVCLGTCKDGQYVYTVGWLDDEEVPAGGGDEEVPAGEPF